MGFQTIDGEQQPRPILRQIGPKAFQLVEPFRYLHPSGPPGGYVVPAHDPDRGPEAGNASDLASVPPFLWWLMASYGQHTLAALLHDHLIGRPDIVERVEADTLFRDGMGDLGVALVRRWALWAAVSVGTLFTRSVVAGLLLVGHIVVVIALALAALLAVTGVAPWMPLTAVAAVVLWGWRWRVALIVVAGVVVVIPATLVVWATIVVTFVIEVVGYLVERSGRRDVPFPKPVPYRSDVTWR